jgi:hypothetical protein
MLVVKVTPRPYCGQGTRLDRTKGALVRDERGWLRVANPCEFVSEGAQR